MTFKEFKTLFLKLTAWTVPFGDESKLLTLLPKGGELDQWGNYWIKIGNSNTLFTTHLDTYSDTRQKVKHVVTGNIIKTDGSTILGGDNKLGTTILCHMISQNKPGTYVFFRGEEPVTSGGLWGSRKAVQTENSRIEGINKVIAFDRRETGSIITRQAGRPCCSDVFADSLIAAFKATSMTFKKDPTGYYTDSASFMSIIPECTNISAGGWEEHTTKEWVNLAYTWKVATSAVRIDWENLETGRNIKAGVEFNETEAELFEYLNWILESYDFKIENIEEAGRGVTMTIGTYFKSIPISFVIDDNKLFMNGKEITIYALRTIMVKQWGLIFNTDEFEYDEEIDRFIVGNSILSYDQILAHLEFNRGKPTAKFSALDTEDLRDDLGFKITGNELLEWADDLIKNYIKHIKKTKNNGKQI